jgi:hypothetical protein
MPFRPGSRARRASAVGAAQGGYYLATGLAPFASRRAFEAVTGPKVDWWLVQTVGALVAAVGGSLAAASRRGRVTPELRALGVSSAAGLAGLEVLHVLRRRISPVYLADAALELAFAAAWLRSAPRR